MCFCKSSNDLPMNKFFSVALSAFNETKDGQPAKARTPKLGHYIILPRTLSEYKASLVFNSVV